LLDHFYSLHFPSLFSSHIINSNYFVDYIFGKTKAEGDGDKRKYDQILEDIMPLLEANPDHKLYVTGHSLGAALSTVVSFFLSCEESIQKPVMCINFASPRVGDAAFLKAVTVSNNSKPYTQNNLSTPPRIFSQCHH